MLLVIGSTNTDMVIRSPRFPRPGETILGHEFFLFPGGKGANQAVAAARLGGEVAFVTGLGEDLFGRQALRGLNEAGIHTEAVFIDPDKASGVAMITVTDQGENSIVVSPGANYSVTPDYIRKIRPLIERADFILMQLEVPPEAVEEACRIGRESGKRLILNPAPATRLKPEVLKGLFLITPNETEASLLTGLPAGNVEEARKAAVSLLESGVENVIVTLGAAGALFADSKRSFVVTPPPVTPVDTTAAGDVFNGALMVALSEGKNWEKAIDFACRAAALSVTRMGAQSSAPYRAEIVENP